TAMSQSLTKTFICSTLALILSGSNAWSQTSATPSSKSSCQSTLEAVPVERISLKELSKLGPELIVAKGNYTMTFWPLEPQDRAKKAGKATIGVSLIQTRDLETPPVGLMILSTQSDELDFVKDGNQILIGSGPQGGCPTRATLAVTETGGVVLRELAVEN
ncbi:MAG TPA: hypothetical protein DIU09_06480, partial [Hyphomonadaceae bacterium]|nr:hypothetical protein [Hyphomonadaceae bacterium]